ncbi:BppU family phage baseplate upper protein [Sporolactobacillus kofuensis]|uniref:BppU family phage baseplate upper protein n=1 Tax=Sporolactobacillus kofuensis TaxID=269672 RepID=A0ABW1WAC8_9BACL|nr:BppU family phage baseplate upper protein [Sporolactobacillus kofuensis]MCO7177009.1 BppU family phage baseplate upper protein [Sporolactobacillus kofuensis]
MTNKLFNLVLDLSGRGIVPHIEIRRNDYDSNVFSVQVTQNGLPFDFTGMNPIFECLTPDGHYIRDDGTQFGTINVIDAEQGKLEYTLVNEIFAVLGQIDVAYFAFEEQNADLQNPTNRVSTGNFTFNVIADALTGTTAAQDYMSDVTTLIQQINQLKTDYDTLNLDNFVKVVDYNANNDSVAAQLADIASHTINKTRRKLLNKEPVVIVCFGDSVTWGYRTGAIQTANNYPAVLQTKLQYIYGYSGITVVNKGYPGQTSSYGLANFDANVTSQSPDLVIIMWGLNDHNGVNDIDYDTYVSNLRSMARKAKASGIEAILMSPTASIDHANDATRNYDLVNRNYAKACEFIAKEQGHEYVDMQEELIRLWKNNTINNSFYDGTVHLVDYSILADIIIKDALAFLYKADFNDKDFISFTAPYVFNSASTKTDFTSNALLRTYYNLDNSKPAEKIAFLFFNDKVGTVLNIFGMEGTTYGNITIQNFGVDLATISGTTGNTRDVIETLTLPGIGLYFIEFSAAKVDAGKIYYVSGIKIAKTISGETVDKSPQTLSLQNSWVSNPSGLFDSAKCFKKNGVVYLAGLIANGTSAEGTVITNLPQGMRPLSPLLCPIVSFDITNSLPVSGFLKIDINGDVSIYKNVKNTYATLNGIYFSVQ